MASLPTYTGTSRPTTHTSTSSPSIVTLVMPLRVGNPLTLTLSPFRRFFALTCFIVFCVSFCE